MRLNISEQHLQTTVVRLLNQIEENLIKDNLLGLHVLLEIEDISVFNHTYGRNKIEAYMDIMSERRKIYGLK